MKVLYIFFISLFLLGCSENNSAKDKLGIKRDILIQDTIVLTKTDASDIRRSLISFEKETNYKMVVYITDKYDDIRSTATRVYNELGIGKDSKGILMLIFPDRKQIRLEVGRGMEGDFTDTQTNNAIQAGISFFKKNEYYRGIYSIINESKNILLKKG